MSLDYEVTKFFQDRQQRFEAALKFATTRMEKGLGMTGPKERQQPTFDEAIQMADQLLAKLEETEE